MVVLRECGMLFHGYDRIYSDAATVPSTHGLSIMTDQTPLMIKPPFGTRNFRVDPAAC